MKKKMAADMRIVILRYAELLALQSVTDVPVLRIPDGVLGIQEIKNLNSRSDTAYRVFYRENTGKEYMVVLSRCGMSGDIQVHGRTPHGTGIIGGMVVVITALETAVRTLLQ